MIYFLFSAICSTSAYSRYYLSLCPVNLVKTFNAALKQNSSGDLAPLNSPAVHRLLYDAFPPWNKNGLLSRLFRMRHMLCLGLQQTLCYPFKQTRRHQRVGEQRCYVTSHLPLKFTGFTGSGESKETCTSVQRSISIFSNLLSIDVITTVTLEYSKP